MRLKRQAVSMPSRKAACPIPEPNAMPASLPGAGLLKRRAKQAPTLARSAVKPPEGAGGMTATSSVSALGGRSRHADKVPQHDDPQGDRQRHQPERDHQNNHGPVQPRRPGFSKRPQHAGTRQRVAAGNTVLADLRCRPPPPPRRTPWRSGGPLRRQAVCALGTRRAAHRAYRLFAASYRFANRRHRPGRGVLPITPQSE